VYIIKRFLRLLAFSALALFGIGSAQAVVLFDNGSLTQDDYDQPTDLEWFAQQFTTGGQAYTLNSVTLRMSAIGTGSNVPTLDIYSGSSGPTTFVGTLTPPGSYPTTGFPNLGTAVFTSPAISLAAGTTYWAVLHALNGSANPRNEWATTKTSLYGLGTGPGYSEISFRSTNAGSTWAAYGNGTPCQMTVDATLSGAAPPPTVTNVPTLSEWGMIIMAGLLALAAFVTMRRRSN